MDSCRIISPCWCGCQPPARCYRRKSAWGQKLKHTTAKRPLLLPPFCFLPRSQLQLGKLPDSAACLSTSALPLCSLSLYWWVRWHIQLQHVSLKMYSDSIWHRGFVKKLIAGYQSGGRGAYWPAWRWSWQESEAWGKTPVGWIDRLCLCCLTGHMQVSVVPPHRPPVWDQVHACCRGNQLWPRHGESSSASCESSQISPSLCCRQLHYALIIFYN